MQVNDTTMNGMLASLIRDHKTTAQLVTSLMNDSAYAYDVTKNLIQMGEVRFASGDQAMKEAEPASVPEEDEAQGVLDLE